MPADLDLTALDALFAAATPGEWTAYDDAICYAHEGSGPITLGWFIEAYDAFERLDENEAWPAANAALIAALHNAWPAIRRRLAIGDAAVEVCDLTADLRSLWKAMGAGSDGAAEAYDQRLKAIDAARAKLRALREGGNG